MKLRHFFIFSLVVFLLLGAYEISDTLLILGDGDDVDHVIEADIGADAANPKLKYNATDDQWQYANDGTSFLSIGSGGGAGGINLLQNENWDFELGDQKWTASGSSVFSIETAAANVYNGSKSGKWDASATGEYLTGTAVTVKDGLDGKLCGLFVPYKGGDDTIDFYAWNGSTQVGDSKTLVTSTKWTTAITTFDCPAQGTTLTARFESTADVAAIYLDEIFLGVKDIVTSSDSRWPSYDESEVTITGSNSLASYVCQLQPEQDTEGNWRLRGNIYAVANSSSTSNTLSITGALFSTKFARQPGAGSHVSASIYSIRVEADDNTDDLTLTASASTVNWAITIDAALESKPTFATKYGPDIFLAGMPDDTSMLGGDWEDITSTLSVSGLGTGGSINDAVMRRDDDTLLIRGRFLAGSGAYGTIIVTLPNSWQIAANKDSSLLGYAKAWNLGSEFQDGEAVRNSPTEIAFQGSSSSTEVWNCASGRPFSCSTNDRLDFYIEVPISGWTTKEYLGHAITNFNLAKDGKAGLVEYKTETIALDGSYTAGSIKITRVNNQVTITALSVPTHATISSAASSSGLIPSEYRPANTVFNAYALTTNLMRVGVSSAGVFSTNYYDWAGSLVSQPDTGSVPSLTYTID